MSNTIALEALKDLYRGYVNTLENGRDRIVSLGGQCDPLDKMEASDPWLISARAAIAALEAEPQDGDVEQALNRMDALLDPSLNLLAVSENSITLQGCRADMLTIRRALRMAPAAREGWQPIETAPVNTQVVALFRGEMPVIAHKNAPNDSPAGWCHAFATRDYFDHPTRGLTHWMPLPTPPKD